MIEGLQITIRDGEAGMRADQVVLAHVPTTDRALVREAFDAGAVHLVKHYHEARFQSRAISKGHKVRSHDVIRISRLYEKTDRRVLPNPLLHVCVVHEDDAVLAFDKPAGMPVHPIRLGETDTLANGMVARYPETATIGPDPLFPALVHRLDTDTSGVILAARTMHSYSSLRQQFCRRQVRKEYVALVLGHPPSHGTLKHYLAHDPSRPGRMLARIHEPAKKLRRVGHAGKKMRWMYAETEYQVVECLGNFALLDVVIRTGVTHQIRCQLATAGFPIVGDVLYGGPPTEDFGVRSRHFLHAAAIECHHPVSGLLLRCEAPPSAEWLHAMARFRKNVR